MDALRIGLAADHAGYELKKELMNWLPTLGWLPTDHGCSSTESCDYADYGHPLAVAVENRVVNFGIAICGSGNGINMTVNKHKGVRAALCWDLEIALLARQHNNANICTIPARYVTVEQAKEMVLAFINEPFEGGRHQRRIDKIPVL